jgi:pyruvate/2-oxoglutarate dehydrogenase complex dihydrolipoamide acyltransferase (E2) component
MTQIVVPVLGESVTEATVAQWLKKEGETVKRDEPIVELETDKVTLEVNAPSDGVISKIMVGEGQNVGVGAILGELSAANDAAKPAAAPTPAPKQEAPKAAAPAPAPAPAPAAPAPQKTGSAETAISCE